MQNVSYMVTIDDRPYGHVRRGSTAHALLVEAISLFPGKKVECRRISEDLVTLDDLKDATESSD